MDEIQNGSVVRTYSRGLELISKLETGNSKRSFYGFDGHGSVRFLTDSTGAVTDTYDYDAFGNLINQTGSTPNNYLFAGEQYDPALGLYYNRARYYNNTTGRFWSVDSYEGLDSEPISLHKYLYADSDPANATDRTGNEVDLVSTVATAAVVGFLASTATSLYLGNGLKQSLGYGLAGAAAAGGLTAGILTGGTLLAGIAGVSTNTGIQVVGGTFATYSLYGSLQNYVNAGSGRQKNVAAVGLVVAFASFFLPQSAGTPNMATEAEMLDAIAARTSAGAGRNVGYLVYEADGTTGFTYGVSGAPATPRPGNPVTMPTNPKFNPTPGFEAHLETQLLEDLATRITPQSQGRVVIVQRMNYVCMSCTSVVQEFQAAYPGMKVEIRQAGSGLAADPFQQ